VKNIINHNINIKETDKLENKNEIKGKEEDININNANLKSGINKNINVINNKNSIQKEKATIKQEKNIDTKKNEAQKESKIIDNKIKEKESLTEVNNIIPKIPKEFRVIEKIENCELKLENRDERCITSFELLRNNRILITFKGGIIKIYELEKIGNVIQLKELLRLEEDEYCFNYGIELKDGNLAVCSEDGTIKIIKLLFDENVQSNEKHKIIQKMEDKNQDPLYTIKQLENEDLAVGCWKNILIYQKADKFELINKIYVNEYTFSILELTPNVIVTSHTESKSLTIHDLNNYENDVIKDIESNENNNIICKYNNKNEIVLVAYDKGINIVSIVKKCLIKKIVLNEIISGLCPIMMDSDVGGRNEKIWGVLCGAKRKIYGENVNYAYSLLQMGFNLNDKGKGEIDIEKEIEYKEISRKDRVHYYDVNNLKNSIFLKNNDTLTIKDDKNEQWIFSAGNEDKLLKIWKF
jgi:WD40 repeat protein